MSVQLSPDSIHLSLPGPSPSTATIALHGATVTSWVVHGEERLFLSNMAQTNGPKAVRGGIPIVFPQFGSAPSGHPLASVPRHGFARVSRWTLLSSECKEDSVIAQFALESANLSKEHLESFPFPFQLIYTITLSPSSLSSHLRVENLGPRTFPFHALFFSYLHVPDVNAASIGGLSHLPYTDKTREGAQSVEESEKVQSLAGIDRVYMGMVDLEVWNPGMEKEKAIDDFESGGWKRMVTLEPGCIKSHLNLPSGEVWEASATYTIPS
ncbi:galactose mutarotase-like domain-containing protein [Piptocephalis cylindrospora]|uniref:Glucose-6-phosphate 1-epimerase n=1 Tax=Piptocephalis cylindrospora TaxID=1907219 RepID=A0A4P9Y0T9_9FUNG|nr:galactose mutarotase-like domain-containing protein [Piptocephalis cylindrospora]|eukprot:RKP12294.1 galactose mutarotase-like domain-containing protein [Piptocephalis cylindrospora]